MPKPICYVGHGLGNSPKTPIPGSPTDYIGWNTTDRRVRMVREDVAADLLKMHPEDFRECVPVDKGYEDLAAEDIVALAKKDAVRVEMYQPKGGAEPVPMLVIDSQAKTAMADEAKAKKKTAKKGKE